MSAYSEARDRALGDPAQFWLDASRAVDWVESPAIGLDDRSAPLYRWFPDGVLNTCVNAVDRHVAAGRGERIAIHYDSPVTGTKAAITYSALLEMVSHFAGVLADLGVRYGDRVLIYMPMVP